MVMGTMRQIVATGTISNMQTPGATETTAATDDLILHVKTTGTATTVTLTDPGTTPAGSVATNPTITLASTEERFIYCQQALGAAATGLVTAAFSGALTGVTAEWLRS
jgi:hypothetical protein